MKDKDLIVDLIVPLSALMIICFLFGGIIGFSIDQECKKPIKPVIQIEDKDGKIDTTYIYRF